jgi:hypothetical protein
MEVDSSFVYNCGGSWLNEILMFGVRQGGRKAQTSQAVRALDVRHKGSILDAQVKIALLDSGSDV